MSLFLPNRPGSFRLPAWMLNPGSLRRPIHLIEAAILLAILGLGIDYARAWLAGMRLQAATDVASVAALARYSEAQGRDAEIQRAVRSAVSASLRVQGSIAGLKTTQITVSQSATLPSVMVAVEATIPTLFLSVVGYENLRVTAKSVARLRSRTGQ